jgi:multidrug efflux pump subunit AcrA (membrane-fusion protein)
MKRAVLIPFLIALICAACTRSQREGWKARIGKATGESKKEAAAPVQAVQDRVELDAKARGFIDLKTERVSRRLLDDVLEAPALIAPDPDLVASIRAPVSGRILSLHGNVGSRMNKGDLVAVIEDPMNAGQKISIRAPIRGAVSARSANPGEWIQAGDGLMEIVDAGRVLAIVRLYPGDAERVAAGMPVELSSGGVIAKGKMTAVSPAMDPATGTVETIAEIVNPGVRLKINAYAVAKIIVGRRSGLAVPETALLDEEEHSIVFIRRGAEFEKRIVRPGIRYGGLAEIAAGLAEGDTVVTAGAYQLKNIRFTSESAAVPEDAD